MSVFRVVLCAVAACVFASIMSTRLGVPEGHEAGMLCLVFVGTFAGLVALSLRKDEW